MPELRRRIGKTPGPRPRRRAADPMSAALSRARFAILAAITCLTAAVAAGTPVAKVAVVKMQPSLPTAASRPWSAGNVLPHTQSRLFTATRPGVYYYSCGYHFTLGQRGVIVVLP